MSELTDLYQEVILDHNKRPRNFGVLPTATHHAAGHNPLCGDRLTLYLELDADRILNVSFEGSGCAISKASTSLMTVAIKGRTVAEAAEIFDSVRAMLMSSSDQDVNEARVGGLIALAGVREFPVRVKCATLPWHTFKAALGQAREPAKTE